MAHLREITVVGMNKVSNFPPVQNLIKILLNKGYKVNFIGVEVADISEDIKNFPTFNPIETSLYHGNLSLYQKIINTLHIRFSARAALKACMKTSDLLWTTSMRTSSVVGKQALQYKTVLQLMELAEKGYRFRHYSKIPIAKYAQAAWKTVVPEVNRAYIQKIWYDLEDTPFVLPNKPFSLDYGEITQEVADAISVMKKENRKIILYLGGIYIDRDFERYAHAISKMNDYVLCIAGKASSDDEKKLLENFKMNMELCI